MADFPSVREKRVHEVFRPAGWVPVLESAVWIQTDLKSFILIAAHRI
jgi:hypothetical protein